MKFQKGQPRHPNAGRKKGSLNKRKIPKVAEYLAERGLNPAEEILKILEEDKALDPKDQKISKYGQIGIWTDLLSYCQAKPKDIERDAADEDEDEDLDDLSDEQLLKIVRADGAK